MRRPIVNALALIGALTLLTAVTGFVIRRLAGEGTGIVLGPDDKPLAHVSVFLDRGGSAIERYVTDTAGAYSLPLTRTELRRAVWLICAPGGIPMVGQRGENQAGPATYGFTHLPDSTWHFYRSSGWRGPIPRECPRGTDTVGWRYPASAGKPESAFTATEPDWSK